MSFLTPFFLLGATAIVGPILFHLIRRITRERMTFSSLMFLIATPPRLTRKSRIEDWLLLALRCLVLGLMALGFARPFLKNPPPPLDAQSPRKRVVLLVDTSASMRRTDLWAEARRQAEAIAREAGPADEFALLTFARSTETRVSFDDWRRAPVGDRATLIAGRLADTSPGWQGTQLGAALVRASELLAEAATQEAPGIRRIVLISDLQSGSHLEALQSYEWPKELETVVVPLTPAKLGNASVQWLPDGGEGDLSATNQIRVRVSNSADGVPEKFQVGWAGAAGNGFEGKPADIYVPAGQNRTVVLPAFIPGTSGQKVLLTGDGQPFDNLIHVVPPEPVRSSVVYWGAEAVTDARQPAFFLRQSLPHTRAQDVSLLTRNAARPVSPAEWDAAALYVVSDGLPAEISAEIRRRVMAGKGLLILLKSAAMADTVARLLGVDSLPVTEAVVRDYVMWENIDFRHPCFAPFADPRFSDFTRIHFWKYRRFDHQGIPDARVVAGFDSGDPGLVEVPAGRGRILMLASGWHPADSQLALSTKFVPLMYSILELMGGAVPTAGQVVVGEPVAAPPGFGAREEVTLEKPSGAPVSLGVGGTNLPAIDEPGLYVLRTSTASHRFAANLDPWESRTSPLSLDDLERLGVPVRHPVSTLSPAAESKAREALQSQEAEGRQKMWRWFVIATLALLLGETVMAGWTTRKVRRVTEVA